MEGRLGLPRLINEVVRDVAEHLGNTPAVCRSSYIDPRLFDRFRAGSTISLPAEPRRTRTTDGLQTRIERAVIELLDD